MEYIDLVNACKGAYTKYETRLGRQVSDYEEIKTELRRIKTLIKYFNLKYKAFRDKYILTPNPKIEDDDIIPIQSVVMDIVISYSKCFDSARKQQGKESRRLVKLQRDTIKNIDKRALDTHDLLMELRDNYVAHTGYTTYINFEYLIGLDHEGTIEIKTGDNYRAFGFLEIKDEQAELLVEEIIKVINRKLETMLPRVESEFANLCNPSKIMLFLNKLYNHQPITDEDLE